MAISERRSRPGIVFTLAALSLLLTGASSDLTYEELCERGRQEITDNKIQDAINTFTDAIVLNPQDSSPYFNRALAYRELKEYDKVITDCKKAIELEPNNAIYYAERGAVHYEMKNLKEALADFTKALDYTKRDPLIYLGRAKVFFAYKDYSTAIANYSRSTECDDQNVHAWIGLARAYYENGNAKDALNSYDRAIRLDPQCALHHYWKAVIYYDLRDFEKVIAETEEALKLDKEFAPALGLHGVAQHYLKKDQNALADFDKALQLSKVDPQTFLWQGRVHYDMGDYQKAIDDFTDSIDRDDKYAPAYRDRAKAYEKLANQENVTENDRKRALAAAKSDRATAKQLEEAQEEEEPKGESRFFLIRYRARLPGLKDRRLNATTPLPEKQRSAGELMAHEARLRAEKEGEPIKELVETAEKIEAGTVVPQLTESAEKTMHDAKEAFDRGSYEIAALGFRSVKIQFRKVFAEYETLVSQKPELWSQWAKKHMKEGNSRTTPGTAWAALALASHRFDNRADYAMYMQKAKESVRSEALTNPSAGRHGWLELSDFQAECGDNEGAKASLGEAAVCCEGLSHSATAGNAYATCAGYAARYGETADWSKYFSLARQKAQQVNTTRRKVQKQQPIYTACVAYAFAWQPEKAASFTQEMERTYSNDQPYLMSKWLAPMHAYTCLAAAHHLSENQSSSRIFESSYAAACANLASFLDPQKADACFARKRLAQADVLAGACDRAWIGALSLPNPEDRAMCLNLILRRYVELGRYAEALAAYECLPAEWNLTCALPWIGEAKARLNRKSMQELKLWTLTFSSPIDQSLVLSGIAIGIRSRKSSTEKQPSKSEGQTSLRQAFDHSAAATPAWWLNQATQAVSHCDHPKVKTAFWKCLALLHHQTNDLAARNRAITQGKKCILDHWTQIALRHSPSRIDFTGEYRRKNNSRSKRQDLADITAILESLLEWEELQYQFGDKEGAFATYLMALKSVEMLPRDNSYTYVTPDSFAAWMATLAGRARRHGRGEIGEIILSRSPWSKVQGLRDTSKFVEAYAALEAEDLDTVGDCAEYVQQRASRSGDSKKSSQAANAAALWAEAAARQGNAGTFRRAAMTVGGLVNDKRAPASPAIFLKLAPAAVKIGDLDAARTYVKQSGVRGPERDLVLAMIVEKLVVNNQLKEAETIAEGLRDEYARYRAVYAITGQEATESSQNLSQIWERVGNQTSPVEKAAICAGMVAALMSQKSQSP